MLRGEGGVSSVILMPQAKMNGTLYQLSDETIPADDVKKFQLQNKVR
jgi:hypothetical protein